MFSILEAALLAAALSVDSLAFAVSYGMNRIKIPPPKALVISVICTLFLSGGIFAGGIINDYIPIEVTKLISCLTLSLLGIWKLACREKGGEPRSLSFKETVLAAAGMSADSIAAGVGTGLYGKERLAVVIIFSLSITFVSVYFGNKLGLKLGKSLPSFFERTGGIILIIIGLTKLAC